MTGTTSAERSHLSDHEQGNYPALAAVFVPAELPSGAVLPNRLVKVAMYEHMAALFGGPPNASHLSLYSQWAKGGWGMIVTGNVQVSADHLTLGRDIVLPRAVTEESLRPFRQLAEAMRPRSSPAPPPSQEGSASETLPPRSAVILQLSHAGRQSPLVIGGRLPFVPALAPSPIRVGATCRVSTLSTTSGGWLSRLFYGALFQTPRAMSLDDIDHVVDEFVKGAKIAMEAGFDGVELHASHGYLLSQFISPKTNERDDDYSAERRPLHILHRIAVAIRVVAPRTFILGVKISSADYIGAGSTPSVDEEASEKRAIAHVLEICGWGMMDFIEISGGDYENPEFVTTSRQAFFSCFSRKARAAVHSLPCPPLILLTGGLHSPATLCDALRNGHADILGVGRGSVECPILPRLLHELLERSSCSNFSSGEGERPHRLEDIPVQPHSMKPTQESSALTRKAQHLLLAVGVLPLPKLMGAGADMAWYIVSMWRVSRGESLDHSIGDVGSVMRMWTIDLSDLRPLAALFVLIFVSMCWIVCIE